MDIRKLGVHEELPLDLLLEADPSEQLVRGYCADGRCFIAEQQGTVMGVFVLTALDSETAEIKNIALAESERGKGLGKRLVFAARRSEKSWVFGC